MDNIKKQPHCNRANEDSTTPNTVQSITNHLEETMTIHMKPNETTNFFNM